MKWYNEGRRRRAIPLIPRIFQLPNHSYLYLCLPLYPFSFVHPVATNRIIYRHKSIHIHIYTYLLLKCILDYSKRYDALYSIQIICLLWIPLTLGKSGTVASNTVSNLNKRVPGKRESLSLSLLYTDLEIKLNDHFKSGPLLYIDDGDERRSLNHVHRGYIPLRRRTDKVASRNR